MTGDTPVARVDLPSGGIQTVAVAEGLARTYAGTDVGVVLLAYTARTELARLVCETVGRRIDPTIAVIGVVAVDGADWARLDSPNSSQVSQGERDLMTAEFLLLDRPTPFATAQQLRHAYTPQPPDPSRTPCAGPEPQADQRRTHVVLAERHDRWGPRSRRDLVSTSRPQPTVYQLLAGPC